MFKSHKYARNNMKSSVDPIWCWISLKRWICWNEINFEDDVDVDLVLLMVAILLSSRFIQLARRSILDCWFLSFLEIKGHADGCVTECSWRKVMPGMKDLEIISCDQECHTLPLNFPSQTLVYNTSAAIECRKGEMLGHLVCR